MNLINKGFLTLSVLIIPSVLIFKPLVTQNCGVILDNDNRQLINSITSEISANLKKYRSVSQSDICEMPSIHLKKALAKLEKPKPDHPGEAMAQRYAQSLSSNGELNAENWAGAREQVKEMRKAIRQGAGISPSALLLVLFLLRCLIFYHELA